MDPSLLIALSEAPGIATACGPILRLIREELGNRSVVRFQPDSHAMVTLPDARLEELQVLLIAHLDEIGGVTLGGLPDGRFRTLSWGCEASQFCGTALQAMDYLAERDEEAFPVEAELLPGETLALRGASLRPFRTVWTFAERASVKGDMVEGKALDPRATVFAVLRAFQAIRDRRVGALFVLAEECAMDLARKAVAMLARRATSLRLIVNADVPDLINLEDGRLDTPAIRIFEGRSMVDPWHGIVLAERLSARGVRFHLTRSRTGSQTALFRPLAPAVSVALPAEGTHTRRARMSLTGIARCIELLGRLAELGLSEELF